MRLTKNNGRNPRRSGFTILETSISVTLVLLMSGTLVMAMQNMQGLAIGNNNRSALDMMADEALEEMVEDLRQSGVVTVGGLDYPYVFDGGAANGTDFPDHVHPPAANAAEAGDNDFGPDREVVFVLPADNDGDQRPDVGVGGALIWDVNEFSYVVVTRNDGVNTLERRINGGQPSVVGRYVERLVVDTATSSGFQIPLGSVRVRIFFRQFDGGGTLMRTTREAVVRLRNG